MSEKENKEEPKFLYHKKGSSLWIDITGKHVFCGPTVPKGYRFQSTQWSTAKGFLEVYEKVNE